MGLNDLFSLIGERFGLVPVYALIVAWMGLQASSVRHLVMMLGIACGVYVTMFKAFNLGGVIDVFGLAARFNVPQDAANGLTAAVFVFGLGFAVFGAKRLVVRKPA